MTPLEYWINSIGWLFCGAMLMLNIVQAVQRRKRLREAQEEQRRLTITQNEPRFKESSLDFFQSFENAGSFEQTPGDHGEVR